MCGICGVVQVGGEARDVLAPGVLDRMTDSMVHRGPDDRGVFVAPGVGLGARRLSIVDVVGGHQPVGCVVGVVGAGGRAPRASLFGRSLVRTTTPGDSTKAWARSSVVEHCVHTAGVASSILAAPTTPFLSLHPAPNR